MSELMAAEWVKLRHRWMPRILALILLAILILFFLAIGTSSGRNIVYLPRAPLAGLVFAGLFAPFIWPVLGGAWSGNEFSWGTIRMVLSRRPNRIEQSLAGLATVWITVGAVLVLSILFGLIGGGVVSALAGHTAGRVGGDLPVVIIKTYFAQLLGVGYYLVLAYAAGTIFRSAAVGIGIGIGQWVAQTVASGIFTALGGTWSTVAQRFPDEYARQLVERVAGGAMGSRFSVATVAGPGIGEALFGLLGYCAVLIAVMLYTVSRRDVTS